MQDMTPWLHVLNVDKHRFQSNFACNVAHLGSSICHGITHSTGGLCEDQARLRALQQASICLESSMSCALTRLCCKSAHLGSSICHGITHSTGGLCEDQAWLQALQQASIDPEGTLPCCLQLLQALFNLHKGSFGSPCHPLAL